MKPPTLSEVREFFKEKGYLQEAADKFFDYYEAGKEKGKWYDGQGREVKNWRMKAIAVWFKPQNKAPIIKMWTCDKCGKTMPENSRYGHEANAHPVSEMPEEVKKSIGLLMKNWRMPE